MRRNLIAISLFNAAKLLREQEEAAATQTAEQPSAAPAVAEEKAGVPTGKSGEPLTVESMIQRLNVIRAGKSFDDPEVFGQLTTLYKGTGDDMKTWLDSFLFNVGRIVQSVSEKPETTPAPEAAPPPPPPAPEAAPEAPAQPAV